MITNIIIASVISFIIGYIIGRVTYKPTRTFISTDEVNQRIGRLFREPQQPRIEMITKDSPFSPETTQSIENTRKLGEEIMNKIKNGKCV